MSDYNYESSEGNDSANDAEIDIENKIIEADDKRDSGDLKGALEYYLEAIQMEKDFVNNDGGSHTQIFNALSSAIKIKCQLDDFENLEVFMQDLLRFINTVSTNEANQKINEILEILQKLKNEDVSLKTIQLILGYFKTQGMVDQYFQASMKLCKIYHKVSNYAPLKEQIEIMKELFQNQKTLDSQRVNQKMMEIYTVELEMCYSLGDSVTLKSIHKKIIDIQSTMNETGTNAIIHETAGKIYMSEQKYQKAETELLRAFQRYSEAGINEQAKNTLKCLYVVSILAKSQIDPSVHNEALVFKQNEQVVPLIRLREAYVKNDIETFNSILEMPQIQQDDQLRAYIKTLKQVSALEKIVLIIKPYTKIKLSYLAQILACDIPTIQSYLVQMIMNKKIRGYINAIGGFFENSDAIIDPVQQSKLTAIENWRRNIDELL